MNILSLRFKIEALNMVLYLLPMTLCSSIKPYWESRRLYPRLNSFLKDYYETKFSHNEYSFDEHPLFTLIGHYDLWFRYFSDIMQFHLDLACEVIPNMYGLHLLKILRNRAIPYTHASFAYNFPWSSVWLSIHETFERRFNLMRILHK